MRLLFPTLAGLLLAACTSANPAFDPGQAPDGSAPSEGGVSDTVGGDDQAAPGPDLAPAPDGFSCVPNSALGCTGANHLLRCNATGDGALLVDCSPYLCNATHKRCNECHPLSEPYCDGDNVVSCTGDGLEQVTPCPDGCENGACVSCVMQTFYKDADQDGHGDLTAKTEACDQPPGYTTSADDCDDTDANAHPGQQSYFPTPTSGTGGFDYNCDGNEEQELIDKVSCHKAGGVCVGHGWATVVPACGKWAAWAQCQKSPMGPECIPVFTMKVQRCR